MLEGRWEEFRKAVGIESAPPDAVRLVQFAMFAGVGAAIDLLETGTVTLEGLKAELLATMEEINKQEAEADKDDDDCEGDR